MAFDIGWMAMTSVLLTAAEKSHLEWGLPAKQMDDHDSVDDPLHTAVREGNVEEVEALLASGRSRLTVRDSLGYTPLHRASDDGLSNVVRVLHARRKHQPAVPLCTVAVLNHLGHSGLGDGVNIDGSGKLLLIELTAHGANTIDL
jgi:ankyrin repeat protein